MKISEPMKVRELIKLLKTFEQRDYVHIVTTGLKSKVLKDLRGGAGVLVTPILESTELCAEGIGGGYIDGDSEGDDVWPVLHVFERPYKIRKL